MLWTGSPLHDEIHFLYPGNIVPFPIRRRKQCTARPNTASTDCTVDSLRWPGRPTGNVHAACSAYIGDLRYDAVGIASTCNACAWFYSLVFSFHYALFFHSVRRELVYNGNCASGMNSNLAEGSRKGTRMHLVTRRSHEYDDIPK